MKRIGMLFLAAMAVSAHGEDLAEAAKTIKLDLSAGMRSVQAFDAIKSLTYSGNSWLVPTGGVANVTALNSGAIKNTLVDAKPGEGYFSFTPVSAGVWTLVHAAAGETFTASFLVEADDVTHDDEDVYSYSTVAAETGTLSLDLAAGIRSLASSACAQGLSYSGAGFSSPTGGAATVVASLEGASYPVSTTLVDAKPGEGTFMFTPAAGGMWLLTHTDAAGGTLTARFLSLSPETAQSEDESGQYENILVGTTSGSVTLDLSAAVREIADAKDLKPITYSASNWRKLSTEVATGLAKLSFANDAHEISFDEDLSDEGEYTFSPEKAGLWNLTHVAKDGSEVSAQLNIAESAILGTYENPYDVSTDEELAAVAADGVYVRIPAGTNLTPPAGLKLVDAGNGIWKVEDSSLPAMASSVLFSGFSMTDLEGVAMFMVKAQDMLRGDKADWTARRDLKLRVVYATSPEKLDANEGYSIDATLADPESGDEDGVVRATFNISDLMKNANVIFMRAVVGE